ncbi:MAG TPA: hypothetical protein VFS46_06590 [Nitrososphaera sp.]|nr:hypothetical protein [Nitrososphaera sp.]
MADTEPPKPQASVSRWHQPYSWLTAAAIGIAFVSLVVAAGFVRGYLGIASTYFGWYVTGESQLPSAVLVIVTSVVITIIASAAGAALLLLKHRLGVPVALAAVAAYFVMDAIQIGLLWDGHHLIYAYTHAEWFPVLYYGYGSYSTDLVYSFYFLYVPALFGIAASLLIGWKKVKSP